MSALFDSLFGATAIRGVFSDRARVQRMLDFEAALARAQGRAGIVPPAAAAAIAAACRVEAFDLDALAQAAATAGNPAIPLVKQLIERVARTSPDAAHFVHLGATSQDAIDTGCVLQLREAFALIEADFARLAATLAALADRYRNTLMVGRTLLQHAVPITFGLKVAGWLDAIDRHRARWRGMCARALVVQFGGASGTLAALGARGIDVATLLADELKLALPALPWHAHRDRPAEVATTCGLLAGSLGKIARDVVLLMQTEVSEVFEPAEEGRGGSSALPHKRNPVASLAVSAAALRVPNLVATMLAAMAHDHERAAGAWHAEWETLPEIVVLTGGALALIADTIDGLQVDALRMRDSLDTTRGLVLAEAVTTALGERVGQQSARELIERACRLASREGRLLRDVLADDAQVSQHLNAADLDRLFDPANYVGMTQQLIDRVLSSPLPSWERGGGEGASDRQPS